jgi:hypothetical protein
MLPYAPQVLTLQEAAALTGVPKESIERLRESGVLSVAGVQLSDKTVSTSGLLAWLKATYIFGEEFEERTNIPRPAGPIGGPRGVVVTSGCPSKAIDRPNGH